MSYLVWFEDKKQRRSTSPFLSPDAFSRRESLAPAATRNSLTLGRWSHFMEFSFY